MQKNTTCACVSPNGEWIASGDISGALRIWGAKGEHVNKKEFRPLAGAIKDISWTGDNQRIAVGGEGRESFSQAFLWDSGSTVGDINFHSKTCNNVDIRKQRPFKLISASDDQKTLFFDGVPFKLKTKFEEEHTNFVNCARFSPDGSKYATAGADGKCFIHDGVTSEKIGELNEQAGRIHKGGVYAIAWDASSKYLLTASGDKTVKIWNFDQENYISNKEEVIFNMGKDLNDMQVGCAWVGDTIISVSLSGNINFLDKENPDTPKKIIKGHSKAIVASCLTGDKSTLFTTSFDGVICHWDLEKGEADYVTGNGHKSQVTKMCCLGDNVVTIGIDDTVRFISVLEKKYKDVSIKLESQPQAIDTGSLGLTVVGSLEGIFVIQDTNLTHKYKTDYEVRAVAINSNLGKVAIGTNDEKVVIYDIEGDQLRENCSFPCMGTVTDVKFSPDDKFIASCTDKKQVKIVLTSDFKTERANWASHATKVNGIAWTPDSKHVASCGVDGTVYTWDVERAERGAVMRGAHSLAVDVTSCQWSSDNTLLTTGRQDCSVRVWQITH